MELNALQRMRINSMGYYALLGLMFGLLVATVYNYLYDMPLIMIVFRAGSLGALLGITLNSIELFIANKKYERLSFITLFLIRTSLFTTAAILLLLFINTVTDFEIAHLSFREKVSRYILTGTFKYDLLIAWVLAVFSSVLLQIGKLHSKGVLLKYVTGRYHHPTETNRIFSFIDIKSSTVIAEELGHLKYSALCRDFFYDITEGILLSKGEIYQYLGDGVIISWPWDKGIDKANCIQCFFYMQRTLAANKEKYLAKFGIFPEFKCGVHGGECVVTWVGVVKRDIVYHGEVLNTASRLEGACNRLEASLLISESLLLLLKLPSEITATFKEDLVLRGKSKALKIFSLDLKNGVTI